MSGDTTGKDTASDILDINDTPDVATWSKGIRRNLNLSSNPAKQPQEASLETLHAELRESEPLDYTRVKKVAKQ